MSVLRSPRRTAALRKGALATFAGVGACILMGASPFSDRTWIDKPPWEWNEKRRKPHPSKADPRARQVYAPVFIKKIAEQDRGAQSVLDAVTQGGAWNRRELAGPAFDPGTGLVLVGTSDRSFYGISGRTGEVVWRVPLQGRVSSTPVVDNENVLFGADDGGIYGLRKGTGYQVFRYQSDSEVTAPLAVSGDAIFAHTAQDTVVALRRNTGEWMWQTRHPLPAGISLLGESAPAAGTVLRPGDTPLSAVFVGHADGQVSAMDATDGRVLWTTPIGKGDDFLDVDADLRYDAGTLYVAAFHGGAHAMDPLSGATLWTSDVDGINRMALTAHTLVVAGPGQVVSLNRADGKVRWRFKFPSGGASTPVVHRGRVLVSTDRGALYVLAFMDGRPLQYYGGKPGFTAAPAVHDDALF
ncbi:MAG: PQQ-binding-like beta-propeller repeat protein, partial [Myxococcota bacterium]